MFGWFKKDRPEEVTYHPQLEIRDCYGNVIAYGAITQLSDA